MAPSASTCEHFFCRGCQGETQKVKPPCGSCRNAEKFEDNKHLQVLLNCYRSLCEYVWAVVRTSKNASQVGGYAEVMKMLEEVVDVKEDEMEVALEEKSLDVPQEALDSTDGNQSSKTETSTVCQTAICESNIDADVGQQVESKHMDKTELDSSKPVASSGVDHNPVVQQLSTEAITINISNDSLDGSTNPIVLSVEEVLNSLEESCSNKQTQTEFLPCDTECSAVAVQTNPEVLQCNTESTAVAVQTSPEVLPCDTKCSAVAVQTNPEVPPCDTKSSAFQTKPEVPPCDTKGSGGAVQTIPEVLPCDTKSSGGPVQTKSEVPPCDTKSSEGAVQATQSTASSALPPVHPQQPQTGITCQAVAHRKVNLSRKRSRSESDREMLQPLPISCLIQKPSVAATVPTQAAFEPTRVLPTRVRNGALLKVSRTLVDSTKNIQKHAETLGAKKVPSKTKSSTPRARAKPKAKPKTSAGAPPGKPTKVVIKKPQEKKGCKCGRATQNPSVLTCRGQRCPCYSNRKACLDCICRGCQNSFMANGEKKLEAFAVPEKALEQTRLTLGINLTSISVMSAGTNAGVLSLSATPPVASFLSTSKEEDKLKMHFDC